MNKSSLQTTNTSYICKYSMVKLLSEEVNSLTTLKKLFIQGKLLVKANHNFLMDIFPVEGTNLKLVGINRRNEHFIRSGKEIVFFTSKIYLIKTDRQDRRNSF